MNTPAKLTRRPLAVAAAQAVAAPRPTPAPASVAAPAPDLATLAAQAISKVEQLTEYLKSGEFMATLTQSVIQRLGTSGQLDELTAEAFSRNRDIIAAMVQSSYQTALGAPIPPPDVPQTPVTEQLVVDDAVAAPGETPVEELSIEELQARFALRKVQGDEINTVDTDTLLAFEAVLPADMNLANTRIRFYSVDADHHMEQVLLHPGYESIALKLFRDPASEMSFHTRYLVQLMHVHSAPAA